MKETPTPFLDLNTRMMNKKIVMMNLNFNGLNYKRVRDLSNFQDSCEETKDIKVCIFMKSRWVCGKDGGFGYGFC